MLIFSRRLAVLFFLVSLQVFFILNANAHSRGESFSKWQVGEEFVDLTYTIKLKDINKLAKFFKASEPGWQQRVSDHVDDSAKVLSNSLPCQDQSPAKFRVANGYFQLEKSFLCEDLNKLSIVNNAIYDFDNRHMHIARVSFANGDISEKILLARDRKWQLYEDKAALAEGLNSVVGSTFFSYLSLGAEHIASGWDHLAFLASICLLILILKGTPKTIFIVVSGFTIGHSISLILTVMGYLTPNTLVVESLIAFSILLLAIEAVAVSQKQYLLLSCILVISLFLYFIASKFLVSSVISSLTLLGMALFSFCYFNLSAKVSGTTPQLLVTALFGLVHGFGFAGSLQEIGLPDERLVLALLSFNLGVEVGQILIVGICLAVVGILSRWQLFWKGAFTQGALAASLCGLGAYWFVERSLLF